MELQIEVELPEEPAALYHLSIGEITDHYRDVMSVLDAHGISQDQAAMHVGLSPTTLTAYGRGYGTAAHRTVPADTLDRLRDLAVGAYWKAAAAPYRAERGWHVTVWHGTDSTGLMRERHPHPLRAQEVADKFGGWLTAGTLYGLPTRKNITPPPLDPQASLRSRWRQAARQIWRAFGDDTEDAAAFLCSIADCCRYTLWQFSTEYRPWLLQVTPSQVLELEAALADLEVGDEVQPYESDVRRAFAALNDGDAA